MTVGTDIIDIGNMDIFVHFFMHTLYVPLLEDFFWWPLHTKCISSWEVGIAVYARFKK